MPEAPLTPERRRVEQALPPPQSRAPFVELGLVSCFSFLRGASDAVDLATTRAAWAMTRWALPMPTAWPAWSGFIPRLPR